jgi:hypothetical protein
MILGMEKINEFPSALQHYEEYTKENMGIDSQLLSAVLRIHAKKGDVASACMNFDKMIQLGLIPSATDYENLIRALANSKGIEKKFEDLRRVFLVMHSIAFLFCF